MTNVVRRVLRPFQQFAATESAAGIVLLVATTAAMILANSPWSSGYVSVWQHQLSVGLDRWRVTMPLNDWIDDGLMAVFFLLVGLEIKRELLVGELASPRRAMLPVVAAIGGVLVPATIYVAVTAGTPAMRGWAIPVATDIAFAIGILALLGSRVPPAVTVFLTALAIVDDIIAVGIIAVFYSAEISWMALSVAAVIALALAMANGLGVRHLGVYLALGLGLWVATLLSGLHPTMAGVALAATIPGNASSDSPAESPLIVLETRLHAAVAFGIVPLFAFANAGVVLGASAIRGMDWRIVAAVAAGLVVGKPVGILAGTALVSGKTRQPFTDVSWQALRGAGVLGGIGFTMSLFVAALAFGPGLMLEFAKVGILSGSLLSGVAGWWLVRSATLRRRAS
jgi:NhaA family Na+:H+ antiporter